jgi:ABC-2 type transport system permease protein
MVTLAAPILIGAFFGAVLGGPSKATRIPIAIVDLDAQPVSKAIVAAMKADATFELSEVPEPEAVRLVREGKVRAAVVIPAGFSDAAPTAMFRPGAKKPEIVVHYDPSQAMALPLVKGLLAEHVMTGVSRAAFAPESGRKLIEGLRAESGVNADLATLSTSIERLQAQRRQARRRRGEASRCRSIRARGSGGREDRSQVNAFAHRSRAWVCSSLSAWNRDGRIAAHAAHGIVEAAVAPVRALLLGSRVASGTIIAAILLGGSMQCDPRIRRASTAASSSSRAVAVAFALLTSTFGLLIAALGNTPEATRGRHPRDPAPRDAGQAWVPTFVFPNGCRTSRCTCRRGGRSTAPRR